jgi:hypothetical protein
LGCGNGLGILAVAQVMAGTTLAVTQAMYDAMQRVDTPLDAALTPQEGL